MLKNLKHSYMNKSKILQASVIIMVIVMVMAAPAGAQTPTRVLLSWQANNFYPADYPGKALATRNTPVTAAVEVLQNGKLVDLSRAEITWYVDEKSQGRAEGLKEIIFTVGGAVGGGHFVRVNIRLGEDTFEGSIRVPISNPIVVLETPYPDGLVKNGTKPEITAVPYFFNTRVFEDLTFFWQVGGGEIKNSGNDNKLILNLGYVPAGEIIQITGIAQNTNNLLLEVATSRVRLTTY